jgi:hypothetical protein
MKKYEYREGLTQTKYVAPIVLIGILAQIAIMVRF